MHRSRRYNAAEGCWMGWERKRGKLEQFNNVVLGGQPDDFSICIGETDALRQCRFVITLDADTMLPPGTAAQMVGTLAHPLNAAVYDEDTGRVASGYSILQPRIEILPSVSLETPFSHLCSGDTAIDIYTMPCRMCTRICSGPGYSSAKVFMMWQLCNAACRTACRKTPFEP